MAGWSHEKRVAFEAAFYAFIRQCGINSKNDGFITLGDKLYYGQKLVITRILDALEQDIHDIYILKSRQLGITTICRALSAFYLGIHRGLSGALVFDTNENKNLARAELTTMIADLPATLKFPAVKKGGDNRDGLTLVNNSKILFKSAGIKKTKASGTLGRSAGLSMAHLSELCSYDNEEGLISFDRSLSDSNPDRLYIRESTARGPNAWARMWNAARTDTDHCCCIFIGWWSHDDQRIERDDLRDWPLYGVQPPTREEQLKIDQVKELYDYEVTQEQLAWYRKLVDPAARMDGDTDAGFEASAFQIQEDPWTEEEAFQITGSIFFSGEKLKEQSDRWVSRKFTPYMFLGGAEFSDMKIYKADNIRNIELKVWEPPVQEAVYVFGIDPAFGENELNDRSAIQVFRCFADGIDQVAEYAYPLISTKHLAHALAGIMAWYGNEPLTEVYYILEINGPGGAVLNELKSLKFQIENGYAPMEEQGIRNIFRNVKQFMYARPDSLTGGGSAWHWKTSSPLKVMIMEELRGFVGNGQLRVRSHDLIEEMKTVARDGDSIEGEGSGAHDDRVMGAALAVHYWDAKIRRLLIVQKRTREAEAAKKLKSIVDQTALFNQNMMAGFMSSKQQSRVQMQRLAMRNTWRYGRR
jgi:hypothetical protein